MKKKDYEEYLNELSPPFESDDWIIVGKHRYKPNGYGTQIRKYDPIAFNVGYHEWKLNK